MALAVLESPLDTLAQRINDYHDSIRLSLRRTVEEAVECGDALLEAKALVPEGTFGKWLSANVRLKRNTAYQYMRLARHRTRVLKGDFETIRDAIAGIAGIDAATANRLTDDQRREMGRMANEDGLTLKEIAQAFGVSIATASYWVGGEAVTMRGTQTRRNITRRKAEARRQEREVQARALIRAGSALGPAYSLMNKTRQAIGKALEEASGSGNRELHAALSSSYTNLIRSHDDLNRAMGIEHGLRTKAAA